MGRILPPKQIYKLVKTLDELGLTEATIERLCKKADLPLIHEVKFEKASWFVWREVVSKVERSQKAAENLIDTVLNEVGDSEALCEFKNEIKTATSRRQDKVAQALEEGKCVVFLGPEMLRATMDGKTKSFNAHFCDYLEQEMVVDRTYYDARLNLNLAYMAQCRADGDDYVPGLNGDDAAKMYKEHKEYDFETDIFKHLARLPLKLVINANADDLLFDELKQKTGVDPLTSCYDLSNHDSTEALQEKEIYKSENGLEVEKKKEGKLPKTETEISKQRPLIYNIFGSFDNGDSVLFTESQFMYFITSVIDGSPPLDSEVMTELIKQDTYLFLGFDFEQWYFKILFELFKVKKEEFAAMSIDNGDREAASGNNVFNREFFEQEFKIYFVADGIRKFITEILKRMPSCQEI